MKAFRFRLKALLELREREEDACKKVVSEAQNQLIALETQLRDLMDEQTALSEDLRTVQQGSVGVVELRNIQEYFALLQDRVAEKQDDVMRQTNVLHQKRELLARAMQDRKTIEKLKEKQYAAWKKEAERQEAAFLDELGTTRYKKQGDRSCE